MLALALLLAAAATAAEPAPAADPLHEGRVYEGLQRPKAGACKRRDRRECLDAQLAVFKAENQRLSELFVEHLRKEGAFRAEQAARQQHAWEALANEECEAARLAFAGGTEAPRAFAACMICQTRLRTLALERLVDLHAPEGTGRRIAERREWRKGQPAICEE